MSLFRWNIVLNILSGALYEQYLTHWVQAEIFISEIYQTCFFFWLRQMGLVYTIELSAFLTVVASYISFFIYKSFYWYIYIYITHCIPSVQYLYLHMYIVPVTACDN